MVGAQVSDERLMGGCAVKLAWGALMREGFPQALAKACGWVGQLSLSKHLPWEGGKVTCGAVSES